MMAKQLKSRDEFSFTPGLLSTTLLSATLPSGTPGFLGTALSSDKSVPITGAALIPKNKNNLPLVSQ
jgi:hypothetical protein